MSEAKRTAEVEVDVAEAVPVAAEPEAATPFLTWLAIVIGAISPVIAYLGNLAFAPVLSVAGLICVPLLARSRRPSIAIALLLALLAWALVTTAWSPVAPMDFHKYSLVEKLTSLKLVLQLPAYATLVVAMFGISSLGAKRALQVLAVSLVLISVLTVLEGLRGGQLYQWIKAAAGQPTRPDLAARNIARAGYAMALLFWPVALVLWRTGRPWRIAAGVLAVSQVAAAALLGVNAVEAATLVSTAVFLLVRFLGRPALWICMGGTVAYLALTPLAADLLAGTRAAMQVAHGGKLSWVARLSIWRTVAQRVDEKPVFGWGLDASRVLKGVPLHPHDGALQLWVELGLVGVVLACFFWIWVFIRIDRLLPFDRDVAAAGAASASAYLTIGALSFGIWQEWWLALGALAALVIVLLARSRGFVFGAAPAVETGGAEPIGETAAA